MRKSEVTIYDIATELSVSPSTVSRALRDHRCVKKSTLSKIKKLAAERGYSRNDLTSSLVNKKTNIIGVIVPQINQSFIESNLGGIEEVASGGGFRILISQSSDSFKHEVAQAKSLYETRLAGIIVFLSKETMDINHFNDFRESGIPVVYIGKVLRGSRSVTITIDYFKAGYLATAHLIHQGCRGIAFIEDNPTGIIHSEKYNGYANALAEFGITADENLIVSHKILGACEAYKCATELLHLSNPPDAIFTASESIAVGVMQCARNKGLRLPQELSIVGFNDDPISLISDPTLSTITLPLLEMGRIAAYEVLAQCKNKNVCDKTIVLDPQLTVLRSSLKKQPTKGLFIL